LGSFTKKRDVALIFETKWLKVVVAMVERSKGEGTIEHAVILFSWKRVTTL